MKEILLAKYGELALKGLNRSQFENDLLRTIRKRLETAGKFQIRRSQSTVYIEPEDNSADIEKALLLMTRVFGISTVCCAMATEKDVGGILADAPEYLKDKLMRAKTFKVRGKRADKSFHMTSMELSAELGGAILRRFPHLSVDVHHPECEVVVEIRELAAYIHSGSIEGAGGMPTGSSGRAAVMLSGGIDSPVAAYMMAKRGLAMVGIHFMSPPYTSDRSLDKVLQLGKKISDFSGTFPVLTVPFTAVQEKIHSDCPDALFTVLMRRSMMRITENLCEVEKCGAIVTGESLGQVASQTLPAISCTDAASKLPVLRPLIGMDKVEITRIARKIDTFDISILPYEDCCTVFTPKHPKTKPRLFEVEEAERKGDYYSIEREAAANYHVNMMHFYDEETAL